MKRILAALAVAAAMALAVSAARAGDAAEAQVLGFSDGLFAFEEYGVQDGSGFPYASIYVVDVADDSWVGGTPIRVLLESESASPASARAEARSRLKDRFGARFDAAGFTMMAHSPLGEVEADPVRQAFAPVLPSIPLGTPGTRYVARLDLYHAEAQTEGCVQVMGDRPMGFRLIVEHEDGGETVLSEDDTIPRSRGCPITYRISQIVTDRAWQPERLAVLLSVFSPGFEGPQRRFIAVTGRLPR